MASIVNMHTSAAEHPKKFKDLASDVPQDEYKRKQLFNLSRELRFALESSVHTIQRICFLVNIRFNTWFEVTEHHAQPQPLQLSMARAAVDLHLFQAITAGPEPGSSIEMLAMETKAEPQLFRTSTSPWYSSAVSKLVSYTPSFDKVLLPPVDDCLLPSFPRSSGSHS